MHGKKGDPGHAQALAGPLIVGIGASAGGLEAVREMLAHAEPGMDMAFVLIQHLDPNHESLLAELIGRQTKLAVMQVSGDIKVDADHVYVIPPGSGLELKDGILSLVSFRERRGMRRPIDDFFISLAGDQGSNAVCVVMSGTGADGAIGLRAIKENGGVAVAQEPSSAKYDSMPLAAVATGLVDFVLEPEGIVETLHRIRTHIFEQEGHGRIEDALESQINEICAELAKSTGYDFSGYKLPTLIRRIQRRMQVLGVPTARDYLSRLKERPGEPKALLRDMLINVTRFFRDPDHFDYLEEEIIPALFERAADSGVIRVWVPGCSSGEEAFTIAMLLDRHAHRTGQHPDMHVFATDIDEQMLSIARRGRFPASAMADIPEAFRTMPYLASHGDYFEFTSRIRDLIRFSQHSLIKDPPYSNIDLVSCRNLLIYLGDDLQKQVIPMFHYSINEGGTLLLGASESIGRFEELFEKVDGRIKIFRRLQGKSAFPQRYSRNLKRAQHQAARSESTEAGRQDKQDFDRIVLSKLTDRYVMPSVVVDQAGIVKSTFGQLSRYLTVSFTAYGPPNITAIARPGIREVAINLVRQSLRENSRVVVRNIEVQSEFGTQAINLIADPVSSDSALLIFSEASGFRPGYDDVFTYSGSSENEVATLQEELRFSQEKLRTTIEELETTNEELKSSNEEMMSMNEELQSTNEELTTVNDELKSKVDQLVLANADMSNFLESTQLALVVVDEDLRIRNFTRAASAIFPLRENDKGRVLTEMAHSLEDDAFLADARDVAAGGENRVRAIASRDQKTFWSLITTPYRLADGRIRGANLVFTDITRIHDMQDALEAERNRLKLATQVAGVGIWMLDDGAGTMELNPDARSLLAVDGEDGLSRDDFLAAVHPADRAAVEAGFQDALHSDDEFELDFRSANPPGAENFLRIRGRRIASDPATLVGVSFDMTPEKRLANARELMIREMNHRVKNLFAVISGMIGAVTRLHSDPREMSADLRERISALGRAHAMATSARNEKGINLDRIITAVLEPYVKGDNITVEGAETAISAEKVTPFALIFHEWATNAVKYGALASTGGRLDVRWHRRDGAVHLDWIERADHLEANDGQAERGFGTNLVDASMVQINGKASVEQKAGQRVVSIRFDG